MITNEKPQLKVKTITLSTNVYGIVWPSTMSKKVPT